MALHCNALNEMWESKICSLIIQNLEEENNKEEKNGKNERCKNSKIQKNTKYILNIKGHQNCKAASKVTGILMLFYR